MNSEPCPVCGSTEVNLVDGFYYCVECGTQDTNVRETVVEDMILADGTFAKCDVKKIKLKPKDGIQMSPQWHYTHALNFILANLVEELIALGAAPTVKMKVLWIFTRYLKKYYPKENFQYTSLIAENNETQVEKNPFFEDDNPSDKQSSEDEMDDPTAKAVFKNRWYLISDSSKTLLLTILYVALQLDESDLQLSHLNRFSKEGHLSLQYNGKFIPEELNRKHIPKRMNGIYDPSYTLHVAAAKSITMYRELDLGIPLVPNMKKIVNNYIIELGMPEDFKNIVYSLIDLIPSSYYAPRMDALEIPLYDVAAMGFVAVAFKICFGLDDDYELMLSEAVDEDNELQKQPKSYRVGGYSQTTNRLFSFREWCLFVLSRRRLLCKHYLTMAELYKYDVDDQIFLEHSLPNRPCKKSDRLNEQITMEILNKIPLDSADVIPKSEFPRTLTPRTAYAEVICNHTQDSEIKLLLSEDFSQYSLKYAYQYLELPNGDLLEGVSTDNKIITNKKIAETKNFFRRKLVGRKNKVYIKKCKNKNCVNTIIPTTKRVRRKNNETIIAEKTKLLEDATMNDETNTDFLTVIEEDDGKNIFDDDFESLEEVKADTSDNDEVEVPEIPIEEIPHMHIPVDPIDLPIFSDDEEEYDLLRRPIPTFDPDKFNFEETVKELVLMKCKKYKIQVPHKFGTIRPLIKRKPQSRPNPDEPLVKRAKKSVRTPREQRKQELQDIIEACYKARDNDILHQVSEQVKILVGNQGADVQNNLDQASLDQNNDPVENNLDQNEADHTNIDQTSENEKQSVHDSDSDDSEHEQYEVLAFEYGGLGKTDKEFDKNTDELTSGDESIDFSDILESDPVAEKIIQSRIRKIRKTKKQKKEVKKNKKKRIGIKKLKPCLYRGRKLADSIFPEVVNYWIRHYSCKLNKVLEDKFNRELRDYFPRSFEFVIKECAAIAETTAYEVYRFVEFYEKYMLSSQCFMQLINGKYINRDLKNKCMYNNKNNKMKKTSITKNS